jgi:Arc/MetJ-type ribon-helix-helix transcriptional regulator
MGRRPLHFIYVNMGFSAETLNRIDELVGKNRRSEFVRQAVDHLFSSLEMDRQREPQRQKEDD